MAKSQLFRFPLDFILSHGGYAASFGTRTAGDVQIVLALDEGSITSRVYHATYTNSPATQIVRSAAMAPVAPDGGPWSTEKLNSLLVRAGYYRQITPFSGAGQGGYESNDDRGGVIGGIHLEALIVGPFVPPPDCVGPVSFDTLRLPKHAGETIRTLSW